MFALVYWLVCGRVCALGVFGWFLVIRSDCFVCLLLVLGWVWRFDVYWVCLLDFILLEGLLFLWFNTCLVFDGCLMLVCLCFFGLLLFIAGGFGLLIALLLLCACGWGGLIVYLVTCYDCASYFYYFIGFDFGWVVALRFWWFGWFG